MPRLFDSRGARSRHRERAPHLIARTSVEARSWFLMRHPCSQRARGGIILLGFSSLHDDSVR